MWHGPYERAAIRTTPACPARSDTCARYGLRD